MYSAGNPVGSQWDGQANAKTKKTAIRSTAQSKMAAKSIHGRRDGGFNGMGEFPHPENDVDIEAMEYEQPDSNLAINSTRELRPVLITMTLAGLYYPPINATKSLPVRLLDPRRLYCFVINIVAWFNALRFLIPIIKNSGNVHVLLTMIASGLWFFQCAFAPSCWFYQCTFAPRRFHAFIEQLHQVYSAVPRVVVGGDRRRLKRTIFLAILIPAITNCFNSFVLTFFTCGPIDELRNATGIFLEPFGPEGKIPMNIVICVSSFPYIFSIGLFALFTTLMSRMFDKFNENFKKGISDDGKLQFSFEKLRHEYQSLAKVVETGNEIFSTYLGFFVVTSLVQVLFLLYLATLSYKQVGELVLTIVWFLVTSSLLVVIFWFSVQIHEKAHDAENYVHDILLWDRLVEGTPIQVMLFLAKLHGKPIALTVWNLTSITKDFVLTVFGLLCSYFIIIAQTFTR